MEQEEHTNYFQKTNKSEVTDSVNTETLFEKDKITPPTKHSALQTSNVSKSSLRTNEFKPSGILKYNGATPLHQHKSTMA